MGDERIRGVHDGGGAAVVALQPVGLAVLVVLLEIEDVLYLGAAEGVDALGVVPHHADVAVDGQLPYDYVLRVVGVLVLVHHYVVEAAGDILQGIGIVAQQDVHVEQDVVEVHHPGLLELVLVQFVEFPDAGLAGMAVLHRDLRVVPVGGHRHQVVLGQGDAGKHLARLVDLVVQLEFLDAGLHSTGGVALVVNGE